MNYHTLDSLRRIANDPTAAPAEREFAERKLREAAAALVVVDTKNLSWRDRAKERTATIIAQERDKREEISVRAAERARNAVEAQDNQERRIEAARANHGTYMAKAQNELEEAQCHLEEQRILRAERLARTRARVS